MANTITSLIPDAYAALDVVSRELVGFIPSVQRDSRADRVALNQTLRSFATNANTAGTTRTPAMAFPTAAYQTIGNKTLTITKSRKYPFSWTGEEQYSLDAQGAGPGYLTVRQDQIAQQFRAAVNDIELDLAAAAYAGASRATGTAGTTPFATNLASTANLRKILDDNGAPQSDRHLVINTTCGAALRTLTQLTKVNEAADTTMLRQGNLMNVHGFDIRETAQLTTVTAGTGANYVLNNVSGYAVGSTTLAMDVGTGTILAGDVIVIGSGGGGGTADTNKYVVTTALSAGSLTIAAPGLLIAHVDEDTVTVGAAFTPNVGFSRNAIVLATRLPAVPAEGDLAIIREVITDPRSGISFEFTVWPGYGMVTIEIALNWGLTVIKPEHTAILLG